MRFVLANEQLVSHHLQSRILIGLQKSNNARCSDQSGDFLAYKFYISMQATYRYGSYRMQKLSNLTEKEVLDTIRRRYAQRIV